MLHVFWTSARLGTDTDSSYKAWKSVLGSAVKSGTIMYLRRYAAYTLVDCKVSRQACSVITRHLHLQEVHEARPRGSGSAWVAITCPRMKALGQSQSYVGWNEYASCVQQGQLVMSNILFECPDLTERGAK